MVLAEHLVSAPFFAVPGTTKTAGPAALHRTQTTLASGYFLKLTGNVQHCSLSHAPPYSYMYTAPVTWAST